jgi:hypothetical protein
MKMSAAILCLMTGLSIPIAASVSQPNTPRRGIDRSAKVVLRDLEKIVKCPRETNYSCGALWGGMPLNSVDLVLKDGAIYSAKANLQFYPPSGGWEVVPKDMVASRRIAAALIAYFLPDWVEGPTWAREAMAHSLEDRCDLMIRHGDATIIVSPYHAAGRATPMVNLLITRSRTLDEVVADDYGCINGVQTNG